MREREIGETGRERDIGVIEGERELGRGRSDGRERGRSDGRERGRKRQSAIRRMKIVDMMTVKMNRFHKTLGVLHIVELAP